MSRAAPRSLIIGCLRILQVYRVVKSNSYPRFVLYRHFNILQGQGEGLANGASISRRACLLFPSMTETGCISWLKSKFKSKKQVVISTHTKIDKPSALKSPNSTPAVPKKARFATDLPLIQVEPSKTQEPIIRGFLADMYHDLLCRSKSVEKVAIMEMGPYVYAHDSRMPEVYCPDVDAESHAASVVDSEASMIDEDRVIALFEFSARSAREMSLVKGDIVSVQKRAGTWIYGQKIKSNSKQRSDMRYRRGPPQPGLGVGWIPVAFVTKFTHT